MCLMHVFTEEIRNYLGSCIAAGGSDGMHNVRNAEPRIIMTCVDNTAIAEIIVGMDLVRYARST